MTHEEFVAHSLDAKIDQLRNVEAKIRLLKNLCLIEGSDLYLWGTDDSGRRVYKIREYPTFKATFERVNI